MTRARSFGVFILALCLVACVCAHGDGSKEDATTIVNEAKAAAMKTLKNAEGLSLNSERYLYKVLAFRGSAERLTEGAAEAANGNRAAEAIAKKVKAASDKALNLYPEAARSAMGLVDKMRPLVTKATTLETKATAIQIETEDTVGYTKAKNDALSVKDEVDTLNNEITTASSSLGTVSTAVNKMSKFMDDAVMAKYHLDVFFAVAKFETVLKFADNDIKLTEQKRDEINATEQEMKKLYDNNPKDLIHSFSKVHALVQGDFRSASDAVAKAKQAKEDILKLKAQADDALVKVEAATNLDKAWDEVSIARRAVKNAEEKLKDTKSALESAEIHAFNALQRKNLTERELNKKPKKPDVTQDNDKTNSQDSANTHQPVQDTTESPDGNGTKKPTVTNPDQSITEQPVKNTTESPTVSGTKKPTVTNSGPPGSGGTKPKKPSSSDSAMTVSVTVLLALIACAALH